MADNLIEQAEEDGYKSRRAGLPRLRKPISFGEGTPKDMERLVTKAWHTGWDKADKAFTPPVEE